MAHPRVSLAAFLLHPNCVEVSLLMPERGQPVTLNDVTWEQFHSPLR